MKYFLIDHRILHMKCKWKNKHWKYNPQFMKTTLVKSNDNESMKFNALQFMNLHIHMHLYLGMRAPCYHNA